MHRLQVVGHRSYLSKVVGHTCQVSLIWGETRSILAAKIEHQNLYDSFLMFSHYSPRLTTTHCDSPVSSFHAELKYDRILALGVRGQLQGVGVLSCDLAKFREMKSPVFSSPQTDRYGIGHKLPPNQRILKALRSVFCELNFYWQIFLSRESLRG